MVGWFYKYIAPTALAEASTLCLCGREFYALSKCHSPFRVDATHTPGTQGRLASSPTLGWRKQPLWGWFWLKRWPPPPADCQSAIQQTNCLRYKLFGAPLNRHGAAFFAKRSRPAFASDASARQSSLSAALRAKLTGLPSRSSERLGSCCYAARLRALRFGAAFFAPRKMVGAEGLEPPTYSV